MGCSSSKVGIIQVEEVRKAPPKERPNLDVYTPDKFPHLSIRIPGKDEIPIQQGSPSPRVSSRMSQQKKMQMAPFKTCPIPHVSEIQDDYQVQKFPSQGITIGNIQSTNMADSSLPIPSSKLSSMVNKKISFDDPNLSKISKLDRNQDYSPIAHNIIEKKKSQNTSILNMNSEGFKQRKDINYSPETIKLLKARMSSKFIAAPIKMDVSTPKINKTNIDGAIHEMDEGVSQHNSYYSPNILENIKRESGKKSYDSKKGREERGSESCKSKMIHGELSPSSTPQSGFKKNQQRDYDSFSSAAVRFTDLKTKKKGIQRVEKIGDDGDDLPSESKLQRSKSKFSKGKINPKELDSISSNWDNENISKDSNFGIHSKSHIQSKNLPITFHKVKKPTSSRLIFESSKKSIAEVKNAIDSISNSNKMNATGFVIKEQNFEIKIERLPSSKRAVSNSKDVREEAVDHSPLQREDLSSLNSSGSDSSEIQVQNHKKGIEGLRNPQSDNESLIKYQREDPKLAYQKSKLNSPKTRYEDEAAQAGELRDLFMLYANSPKDKKK